MSDNDKPKLTVINGGKGNDAGKRRSPRLENGLTVKQEAFCKAIVQGMSHADAYRSAFDVGPNTKDNTVHVMACKLAKQAKVQDRLHALRAAAVERASYVDLRTSDRLLKNLWALAESEKTKDAARVSALQLIAKMSGLLVDKVETKEVPNTVDDIDAILRDKLAKLASA